ncbi:prephenate/arogenate dehydrogenase [Candidatus Synechococcus calcipolaris G9]|uniref:Prephenate/arogenate dehydrogenase n=1 Tax=Candidatus Synechococcus calcipolaris G9 TaxID=1497997 RepID=A0ABT6EXC8_9SYNE|nr:prephenate/arogenate dehydrogenase [Candidatus Synechococcus calcipolaris]MDG2989763.1 prephenate/arogenate dehydrogenase [Candidatus Synechococcus calcipolaris G9]
MDIGIVGLGLMGGSLGLDFRALGHRVLGVSRRSQTWQRALERGAIDAGSTDLGILSSSEVVFLCPPLGQMVSLARQIIPHLNANAILTDIGSVKGAIVPPLEQLWPHYVGGHPMAGTAETGIEAAQHHLFANCPYVLTPTERTNPADVETLATLITSLGSRLYRTTPETHDLAVAWISHLPVMVSSALILACANGGDRDIYELAQDLASSGFRDTSRVGGGNPELGQMMAQFNQGALLGCLKTYRRSLEDLILQIEAEAWDDLRDRLAMAQRERRQFDLD